MGISASGASNHTVLLTGLAGLLDSGDRFGRSVTGVRDFDGDGVGDMVVGAPADDDGGIDRGAVYVLLLNADGSVKHVQKISSTQGNFDGVLKDYPSARKRPDALLKAGYCQYELKRYAAARATLTRLTQEFPDTPLAAEAAERLARMKTEGR